MSFYGIIYSLMILEGRIFSLFQQRHEYLNGHSLKQRSLQLLNSYLGVSETFIYNTLSGLKKFTPTIIAESQNNLDVFPLPEGASGPFLFRSAKVKKFASKLVNKYAAQQFPEEVRTKIGRETVVAHAHYGYRAVVCLDEIRSLNIPLITQFYGFDLTHTKYLKRVQKQYAELFKYGSLFLVEGKKMADRLSKLGCPDKKIRIHPIGIFPKKYDFSHRNWDGNRRLKMLFVGRFVEKKGLLGLLDALAQIKGELDFSLTIVGGGPQETEIRKKTSDLFLGGCVRFEGYVKPSELSKFMANYDLMLQPSHTAKDGDCEGGAPTTLLEAQALGIPVVATVHDDIPNVLAKCYGPFLAKEGNIDDLREKILEIVKCHNNWEEFSNKGRAFVEENHDINKLCPSLENMYAELTK